VQKLLSYLCVTQQTEYGFIIYSFIIITPKHHTYTHKKQKLQYTMSKELKLEMWANAQRDGRPAEHRWRPLFNAAKFG